MLNFSPPPRRAHLALVLALLLGGSVGCPRSEKAQLRDRLTAEVRALGDTVDAVAVPRAPAPGDQALRSAPRVVATAAGLEVWIAPWLAAHLPGPDASPGTTAAYLAGSWRVTLQTAADVGALQTRLHDLTSEDLPGLTLVADQETPLSALRPLVGALHSGELRRLWIATAGGGALELAAPRLCHGAYDARVRERPCARAVVRLAASGPRLYAEPAREDAERGCELGVLLTLGSLAPDKNENKNKEARPHPCVPADVHELAGALSALGEQTWCGGSLIEAPGATALQELVRLSAALRAALPTKNLSWSQSAAADVGTCANVAEATRVEP